MHDFYTTWHSILSPHQEMRAELAAWPYGVFPFRLIRFLGARALATGSDAARHRECSCLHCRVALSTLKAPPCFRRG